MDVGAGVADDIHADFLRNLEALHPGDEGGAEAVEALPGLLAPAGGGVAGVDAGGLERVVLNDKLEDIRRETLLTDLHQRIRDVRQGPDGLLYVLTDGDEFAVLRVEPN